MSERFVFSARRRQSMPTRQFRDPSGTEWEVFEVRRLNDRPNSVRPALSSGWLAFVSEREKRRLPHYPADWMELPEEALFGLLGQAFVAAEPPPLAARSAGDPSAPAGEARERFVDRRKRPRPAPGAAPPTAPAPPADLAPATTVTSVTAFPATAGGLPVPPPVTVTGTLGVAGIEALVRTHARQARQDGVAVIEAMIGVKRALTDAGEDVSPETMKLLRKVFVDEFYFSI